MALNNILIIFLIVNFLSCLWVKVNDYFTERFRDDYMNAYYFVLSTGSTIGYGDYTVFYTPTIRTEPGSWRIIFAIFVIVFGFNFFAYIISYISRTVAVWFEAQTITEKKYEDLSDWIAVRNNSTLNCIPWNFEKQIKEYFVYIKLQDVAYALKEHSFIEELPYEERSEIVQITSRKLIEKFQFFREISAELACQIILLSQPHFFPSGGIVIHRNSLPEGVHFVLSGQLKMIYQYQGYRLVVGKVSKNSSIGDFTLFDAKSHFDYKCSRSTLTLFVPKDKLEELLQKEANYSDWFKLIAYIRLKFKTNYLDRETYLDRFDRKGPGGSPQEQASNAPNKNSFGFLAASTLIPNQSPTLLPPEHHRVESEIHQLLMAPPEEEFIKEPEPEYQLSHKSRASPTPQLSLPFPPLQLQDSIVPNSSGVIDKNDESKPLLKKPVLTYKGTIELPDDSPVHRKGKEKERKYRAVGTVIQPAQMKLFLEDDVDNPQMIQKFSDNIYDDNENLRNFLLPAQLDQLKEVFGQSDGNFLEEIELHNADPLILENALEDSKLMDYARASLRTEDKVGTNLEMQVASLEVCSQISKIGQKRVSEEEVQFGAETVQHQADGTAA